MSDPAIQATYESEVAESIYRSCHPGWRGFIPRSIELKYQRMAQAAIAQTLKPVRELHQPVLRTDYTDERWVECTSCCGEWPCDTAKLIYSTEELES